MSEKKLWKFETKSIDVVVAAMTPFQYPVNRLTWLETARKLLALMMLGKVTGYRSLGLHLEEELLTFPCDGPGTIVTYNPDTKRFLVVLSRSDAETIEKSRKAMHCAAAMELLASPDTHEQYRLMGDFDRKAPDQQEFLDKLHRAERTAAIFTAID